jgi:NAD-dependent dihydropyrimidine dehydrogenase PreA subunit
MTEPVKLGKGTASIEISLRGTRCKQCGYCIEFCPKGVFASDGGRPVVEKGELCTGCALCVWICPEFAVKVRRSQGKTDGTNDKG